MEYIAYRFNDCNHALLHEPMRSFLQDYIYWPHISLAYSCQPPVAEILKCILAFHGPITARCALGPYGRGWHWVVLPESPAFSAFEMLLLLIQRLHVSCSSAALALPLDMHLSYNEL